MVDARVAVEVASGDKAIIKRMEQAVVDGGGKVAPLKRANALVFSNMDAKRLEEVLDAHPGISWVQLPMAGVEGFAKAGVFTRQGVTFTCAKGIFGSEVGEHAFMLALTALRHVVYLARRKKWTQVNPRGLSGLRVTMVGAGGIAESATRLFNAADSVVTVLRKSDEPFPGAARTLAVDSLHKVLPDTDVLVLAMPLTGETAGMIGKKELSLLPNDAVLVNVARGKCVDTGALVKALKSGKLAAAGLDVTEPEPLPRRHKLWKLDNVLITSHRPNTSEVTSVQLARRVTANVAHFIAGQPVEGVVDPVAGY